jgi:uncharacterized protein YciI
MQRRALCLAPLSLLAGCSTPPVAPTSDLWFIFLESGRPTPPDKAAVAAMQTGHIDNFKRLFGLGQLLAAGPLADPGKAKRGIVVVRADSLATLTGYFQPDAYVRDGYMQVNARRAVAHAPLHTEGIDPTRLIVAYEPIWAIGTGKTCAAEEANRICALIRGWVGNSDVIVQYGGSVNPATIDELMAQSDIDGVLVGGASLDPVGFARIADYQVPVAA